MWVEDWGSGTAPGIQEQGNATNPNAASAQEPSQTHLSALSKGPSPPSVLPPPPLLPLRLRLVTSNGGGEGEEEWVPAAAAAAGGDA